MTGAGGGGGGRARNRRDVATTFLRWTFFRAAFHRGYVLTSGLYFVVIAHLTASQLILLGAVMSVTLTLTDVPAGAWSDAFSRKWPLVIGHGFMAAGMVLTGLVTAFPLLLVTQVLWALGWAFAGGADVAWLTDELDRPDRIARVLTLRARRDLTGGAAGMVWFGLLGWAAGLGPAIEASGVAMAALGLAVAAVFTEDNFRPASAARWRATVAVFRRGLALARRDREILLVLASTAVLNGAAIVAWLFPRQLVDLGFPGNLVIWYTALGVAGALAGAAVLRFVETRIDGAGVARRVYAVSCGAGALGLVVLACAPDALVGCLGILVARGVAFNVTRAVSVVWVNARTTSDVRATLHSLLSQAESFGEIIGGFGLALLAREAGISATLIASGVLVAAAGVVVVRPRKNQWVAVFGRRPPAPGA